jgi:hypothetical protein
MPGGGTCYSKEGEPVKDAAPKPKPITLVKPASSEQVPLQMDPETSNETIKENDVGKAPPMPDVVVKPQQESPAPTKVKPQLRLL